MSESLFSHVRWTVPASVSTFEGLLAVAADAPAPTVGAQRELLRLASEDVMVPPCTVEAISLLMKSQPRGYWDIPEFLGSHPHVVEVLLSHPDGIPAFTPESPFPSALLSGYIASPAQARIVLDITEEFMRCSGTYSRTGLQRTLRTVFEMLSTSGDTAYAVRCALLQCLFFTAGGAEFLQPLVSTEDMHWRSGRDMHWRSADLVSAVLDDNLDEVILRVPASALYGVQVSDGPDSAGRWMCLMLGVPCRSDVVASTMFNIQQMFSGTCEQLRDTVLELLPLSDAMLETVWHTHMSSGVPMLKVAESVL